METMQDVNSKENLEYREILDLLCGNARLEADDIAAMTGKEVDEVRDIIKKLEDDGIILKYTAIVDRDKVAARTGAVRAEIEVQVTPQRDRGFDSTADRILRFPQVKSLYLMSGGYDLKVVIEGATLHEVAFFVSNKLAPIEGVKSTKTHFHLKTYKENDVIYSSVPEDTRQGMTA
jgi:DNA-binding Lrp family transcriptional regulator